MSTGQSALQTLAPEITPMEYQARVEKVRSMMREKNLDAAIIYHDELHMYNGVYLTGYWPTIEAGAVLVPAEGKPYLLGGPEAGPYAMEASVIKDMLSIDCFVVPEEEYPGSEILSVPEAFKRVLGGRKLARLGFVGYEVARHGFVEALRQALPKVEFVDITREYTVMRAVKSETEIAITARTFDLGAEGIRAGIKEVRPGAMEREVVGAAEGRMRSLGIDWFNFRSICAAGPRSNGVVPPATDRKMRAGELLLLGFGPKLRGYSAGTCISIPVDTSPDPKQLQFLVDLADALELTRDALKPGIVGSEIDKIPRQFLTKKGYGDYLAMGFVHTVGLNEFELPFFGPNSQDYLEENLTVCIDISLFGHPLYHGVRHEAGFVIRPDGAESLSEDLEGLIYGLRDPQGEWSRR